MVQKKNQITMLISQYLGEKQKVLPLVQSSPKYLFEDDDLLIPKEILDCGIDLDRNLQICYLTLCRYSRVRHHQHGDIFEIFYPLVDGEVTELTVTYSLPGYHLRAFYFTGMYSLRSDPELYLTLLRDRINVQFEILHSREDFEDGQLKILLDVILATDDMIQKEGNKDKNVLVVGSSSENGVSSGFAYQALPLMLESSKVDLYDPNNNKGSVVSGTVSMNFFKKRKKLVEEDLKKYDLLLDDAWEEKMSRSWDQDNCFSRFKNYSVKWFHNYPEMPNIPYVSNRYYQVFKTPACELRVVSRQTSHLSYSPIPLLGNCPGCRELKYRLRGKYSDSLYRFFMASHKVNCIDKSIFRTALTRVPDKSRKKEYTWYQITDYSDFRKFRCMYYDKWSTYYDVIPVNQVFDGDSLVFSDFQYVTQEFYDKCFVVVFFKGKIFANVSDMKSFRYTGSQISIPIQGFQYIKKEKKRTILLYAKIFGLLERVT